MTSLAVARYAAKATFAAHADTLDADWRVKALAVGAIVVLTLVNMRGVKEGAIVMNVLTATKLVTVVFVLILGCIGLAGYQASQNFSASSVASLDSGGLAGFGGAVVSVMWSFDGWNQVIRVLVMVRVG